ncbi:MAG: GtrA family protein [Clostridia bacterium]|nr:GtrA family protein [Clostridia bacterium]
MSEIQNGQGGREKKSLKDFILDLPYIIKYAMSSVLAFVIDYILTIALNYLLVNVLHIKLGMEIAMFAAWVVSSNVNFNVNRFFVFRDSSPYFKAYIKYYALAALTFLVKSYVLIELFTRVFKIRLEIAKPIAETLMFIVTYIVQKFFIFTKKKKQQSLSEEDINE